MFHHHLGIEAHTVTVNARSRRSETLPGVGMEDVDTGPLQHLQRGEMDGLDLVVGDDPGWRLGVAGLNGCRLITDHRTGPTLASLARPNLGHRDKVAAHEEREQG